MNTKMLMKWFYDHNIIIREEKDIDRLKHLTYIAGCIFNLDETVEYKDNHFIFEIEYEDYNFDKMQIFLLNCINREFGYDEESSADIGLEEIKYELGDNFSKKYNELNKYYQDIKKELIEQNKDYDFSKRVIYNGKNIFFLNFKDELSNKDLLKLKEVRNGQKSFEVYKEDGELDIW